MELKYDSFNVGTWCNVVCASECHVLSCLCNNRKRVVEDRQTGRQSEGQTDGYESICHTILYIMYREKNEQTKEGDHAGTPHEGYGVVC